MDWKDMLAFCFMFHAVEYLFRFADRYQRETALTKALEGLRKYDEKATNELKRIK